LALLNFWRGVILETPVQIRLGAPNRICQIFGSGQRGLLAAPRGAASIPLLWLPKSREVQFGALSLKMREPTFLILSKIPEKIQSFRPVASPSASSVQPRRKIVFTIFDLYAPPKKLLKGKDNFSARFRAQRAAAGLRFGSRAKNFLPLNPSTPCSLAQNGTSAG
jgi:hypothetical protein